MCIPIGAAILEAKCGHLLIDLDTGTIGMGIWIYVHFVSFMDKFVYVCHKLGSE